jgi:hypothetical protein
VYRETKIAQEKTQRYGSSSLSGPEWVKKSNPREKMSKRKETNNEKNQWKKKTKCM